MPDPLPNGVDANTKLYVDGAVRRIIDDQPIRESQRPIIEEIVRDIMTKSVQKIQNEMTELKSSINWLKWSLPIAILVVQLLLEIAKRGTS